MFVFVKALEWASLNSFGHSHLLTKFAGEADMNSVQTLFQALESGPKTIRGFVIALPGTVVRQTLDLSWYHFILFNISFEDIFEVIITETGNHMRLPSCGRRSSTNSSTGETNVCIHYMSN